MQLTTKGNVVLYLDKELVEKSKELGFNLSKTFENHLKQLILRNSSVNKVNNFNSYNNKSQMVGPPGFEPGSIAPEAQKLIDWSEFKQFLLSKYVKAYAVLLFESAQKYQHLLSDVNGIQLLKPTIRNNIINALLALSRYQGNYDQVKSQMKSHGVKHYKPDQITTFTRIFNTDAHEGLGEWYNQAMAVLGDNEKLYLRFMLLSGVRAMEGINSFNLIVDLGSKYSTEYYNENTSFLEHFKHPKLFLRGCKNVYISAVPKQLLNDISRSSKVSYNAFDKKLDRAGLGMRIKQLRSFYATAMRENGILSEQIDLIQGRVGKSIFLQHYFKQDAIMLSNRILGLLPKIEHSLSNVLS